MEEKKYYYFARDDNGDCSLWEFDKNKMCPYKEEGIWDVYDENKYMRLVADGKDEISKVIGKGMHGVRKGQCKKIKVLTIRQVTKDI